MQSVRTVDYHTAGEPFRIVLGGVPDIPGATVLERRACAQTHQEVDVVRRLLCHEPRGHADMYGCFLVPPDAVSPEPASGAATSEPAHLGVLFWHKDGYSTACGHGTIALGAWAVHSGLVAADPDGETEVRLDVPSGRVVARVQCRGGAVRAVTFRNVPSYVIARGVEVRTARGDVHADLAYGGAIYACLPASAVGLAVRPEDYAALIAIGRQIKWALNDHPGARHPDDDRLSGVYGTILFDDLGDSEDPLPPGVHQRNVTVFADGEVDRSPCGSGTAARLALLTAQQRLAEGTILTHDSIIGTRFTAVVARSGQHGGRPFVVPEVTGTAHRTGEHTFILDADDELGTGFVLR